jgi:hypothetical protein
LSGEIIMSESQERSAALRERLLNEAAELQAHRARKDLIALLREAAASLSPQPAPAQGNAEEALLWAESAGQRYEISQMSSLKEDIRASYERRAKHDMAKARALLGLPPSSGGTPVSQPAPAPQKGE